ncbi:MAG: hypothetical protein ACI8QW_001738, partial [Saprospiraceae bacterium]
WSKTTTFGQNSLYKYQRPFFWVEIFDHKALKNTSPDINRDLTKEINGVPTGISKRFLEMDE